MYIYITLMSDIDGDDDDEIDASDESNIYIYIYIYMRIAQLFARNYTNDDQTNDNVDEIDNYITNHKISHRHTRHDKYFHSSTNSK